MKEVSEWNLLLDVDLELFDNMPINTACDVEECIASSNSRNDAIEVANQNVMRCNKKFDYISTRSNKRGRIVAKDELECLRNEVKELHVQLDTLVFMKNLKVFNSSKWEALARIQAVESYLAIQENAKLKTILVQQKKSSRNT